MNYNESGVNISVGNSFIQTIVNKQVGNSFIQTIENRVLSKIGGFNALFDLTNYSIKNPVLVSSTDGVGTKLLLSQKFDRLDTIGIDLVAMVVNDIIISGAKPLFFLDYYATGRLDLVTSGKIIDGIITGCNEANIVLVGGETAEMPLLYSNDKFDLAGFGVGIVDREKIINSNLIRNGNIIIGIPSSGPHSNGFSLINKIFDLDNLDNKTVNELLAPTKIYVKLVEKILEEIDLAGIAHITGGGLTENLPRILPDYMSAFIKFGSWEIPDIFKKIQNKAQIGIQEMLTTFNCGIGLCLIVDVEDFERTQEIITECGEISYVIGQVIKYKNIDPQVIYGEIYEGI